MNFAEYVQSSELGSLHNAQFNLNAEANFCIQESFNKTRMFIKFGFYKFLCFGMALYTFWFGFLPIITSLLVT